MTEDPNIKLLNLIYQLTLKDYNNLHGGVKQQLEKLLDAISEYKNEKASTIHTL